MSDYIPIELQYDINNRLPVKSILAFRDISKQWKSYIDSSDFIQQYGFRESANCSFTLTYEQGFQSFMRMVNEDFQFTPLNSNLQLSCLSPIGTSEGYEKILGDDGNFSKTYVLVSFDLINHHFQVFEIPQQLRGVLPSPIHISQLKSSVVLSRTFSVGDIVSLCGWDLAVDGASVTSFSMLFSIPTMHSIKLICFTNNDAPIVEVDELGYQLAHTLQLYDPVSEEFRGVCMEVDGGSFYIGTYKESLMLLNRMAKPPKVLIQAKVFKTMERSNTITNVLIRNKRNDPKQAGIGGVVVYSFTLEILLRIVASDDLPTVEIFVTSVLPQ
ncbi:F-box domain containing protein [Tanacetum coccineum]